MNIYRHANHTVYSLKKNITFMKEHDKMIFLHKGKLIPNFRFKIYPHKEWKYFHWFIRQPYFYFERNNGGIRIGTPNKYLWFIKSYR